MFSFVFLILGGWGGGGQQNKMGKYIFTNLVAPNKLIGEFLITNLSSLKLIVLQRSKFAKLQHIPMFVTKYLKRNHFK